VGSTPIAVLAVSDERLLAAQNLEYAPTLDPFRVEPFLRSIGSDLADYAVEQGDRHLSVANLVSAAAERHAVNPRVLLVLIELATGVVSAPSPEVVMRAAGYPPEAAPDVAAQIERLAATLSSHYVAAFMGDEPVAVRGPEGGFIRVTGADPAPVAIARTLAETLPLADLGAAVTGPRPGFADLYTEWFGDPREIPAFARGITLPADAAWPFEGTRRHTGGPHLGSFCSQQDILAASGLDFGGESHEVLAMADGRYLGRGETTASGLQAGRYVLVEHEGGVQVMYWHLAGFTPEVLALAPGTEIPKGYPVGWSGRSGNQSAVHLHIELRRGAVASNPYSGVRVSWDGQTVDGWTVRMFRWPGRSDRGISYRGSAARGATRVLRMDNCTCDQASADAVVSAGHLATSTPRNGMDANTVLANYPDVGLLPSGNSRTTALWATAEKVWRNRLPWYYLIDARGGEVGEVNLDGVPLFSAPECAHAVWLSAGERRLTWRYRPGRRIRRAGSEYLTVALCKPGVRGIGGGLSAGTRRASCGSAR
jgi:murein DD-endopeptidase MepM/ murein hydrolase activator NlpD